MAEILIKQDATAKKAMQEESEKIKLFSLRLLENKTKMKENKYEEDAQS